MGHAPCPSCGRQRAGQSGGRAPRRLAPKQQCEPGPVRARRQRAADLRAPAARRAPARRARPGGGGSCPRRDRCRPGGMARAQLVDRREQRRQARIRGLHEALVRLLREALLARLVQRGIGDLPWRCRRRFGGRQYPYGLRYQSHPRSLPSAPVRRIDSATGQARVARHRDTQLNGSEMDMSTMTAGAQGACQRVGARRRDQALMRNVRAHMRQGGASGVPYNAVRQLEVDGAKFVSDFKDVLATLTECLRVHQVRHDPGARDPRLPGRHPGREERPDLRGQDRVGPTFPPGRGPGGAGDGRHVRHRGD